MKHIGRLEHRIQTLEKTLGSVNALLRDDLRKVAGRGTSSRKASSTGEAASDVSGASSTADGAPAANTTSGANTTSTAQTTSGNQTRPGGQSSSTPAALAEQADMDALRELTVIRDQAVTVKPGGFDVSAQTRYLRHSTALSFSRAVMTSGTLRYGILPGVEISGTVPYYQAYRKTQIGPVDFEKSTIESIGDVSAQVNATLFRETPYLPGVFGYVGVNFPTGPAPYIKFARDDLIRNPIDPFGFYQSSGHYSGVVGATMAKTVEPVVLFAGASYVYSWERTFSDTVIQPGDRFNWNFGFGLAVSERTTIGAAVQGAVQQDIKVNGKKEIGASAEPIALVLSLSQKWAQGFYLEPSVTVGMTTDVPAAAFGVGVRKSF